MVDPPQPASSRPSPDSAEPPPGPRWHGRPALSQTTLILVVLSFHFIRYGITFPLIPLLAKEIGSSPAVIGAVVGSFGLFPLFLSVPSGGLTDAFGTRRMLLLGVACNLVSGVLLVAARTVPVLVVSQLVGGLGFQLHVVTCQSYVSRLPSAAQREKGFGYLTFGASIGQMVGPVLGGLLAGWFGFRTAFAVALAVSMVGLVAWLLPHAAHGGTRPPYRLKEDFGHARELLRDWRMVAVLSFSATVILAVSLRMSFLPVLLQARGLGESLVGLLISVLAATSTLVRPFVGRLLARYSRKALLAFAALAIVVGITAIPWLSTVVSLALALGVFGIGFGLTQPLSMVMVADLSPPERAGVAMGLRFTALTLANLLGPPLLGVVVEAVGLGSAFYVSAGLMALVAIQMLVVRPQLVPGPREGGLKVDR